MNDDEENNQILIIYYKIKYCKGFKTIKFYFTTIGQKPSEGHVCWQRLYFTRQYNDDVDGLNKKSKLKQKKTPKYTCCDISLHPFWEKSGLKDVMMGNDDHADILKITWCQL